MSGDVQPRKRKDKKRKKDDLGVEETRGTAAVFGEGDVLMHSHHEHGTGGHWCAKIIFFSLLAILITLIGLIILENRGLSDLEASAVESRYSGVLEGWLEDAPDDDHHDEHTLELKDHDDDHGEDLSQLNENNNKEDDRSVEADDDDNESEENYDLAEDDEDHEDDGDEDEADYDNNQSEEDDSQEDSLENDEEEEEHDEEDAEDEIELEKLEKEVTEDEEPISIVLPALPEHDDDDDKDGGMSTELEIPSDDDGLQDEDKYLEMDDIDDSNQLEHITAPPGKPLVEVEEDDSSEQPPDTLAEEEEYEKRQEELRREEEQSSHNTPEREETAREETPVVNRRMTLIPEEQPIPVSAKKSPLEMSKPKFEKIVESVSPLIKTIPISQESEEEEEDEEEHVSDEEEVQDVVKTVDKELYSDDEDVEEDEEIVEEKKEAPKQVAPVTETKPEAEQDAEEDLDDVEIIDDEQIEEELEEEEEEDISDVDDVELLTRLEAKYGRLPEPERPGPKHYKDGGNSLNDDWPGEPSDLYWRRQLESAERELRQGKWSAAAERAGVEALRDSARARWIAARSLDLAAEAKRDNKLLSQAITAYIELLKMNERLSDKKLREITTRTLDRIQFRGNYLNAEPIHRLLIRRFPNEPAYRNNMTVSFLMANRNDLAEQSLKETLERWPNDKLALAHYGFILKMTHKRYEQAVKSFQKALEGDTGPAVEARFYYHYGDSLLLLGRFAEAHEVHKRAAALGLFLSPAQRSFYNVPRLKSSPWWNIAETPYVKLANALEKSWKEILKEGEAAKALYEKEKEGLKERGEWSQLDLFVRGREIPERCKRAPVTCSIIKAEASAAGCRRGQVKFSAMAAGTHVRPHVGPTNCRLRMHLGLSNTKDTYIRVDQEIRQWQVGKVIMFDDSFEHEVWHNGTGSRLVLIVDVWHPHLTPQERRQLPAI